MPSFKTPNDGNYSTARSFQIFVLKAWPGIALEIIQVLTIVEAVGKRGRKILKVFSVFMPYLISRRNDS